MDEIISSALNHAKKASLIGEVPIAAIVFHPETKEIITQTHNLVETLNDPTAHAEMLAIRESCGKIQNKHLNHLAIFITLEPCAMCMQAMCFAQFKTIYFGAYDYKKGAISTHSGIISSRMNNYKPEIFGGFKESECSELISSFFKMIRKD